MQFVLRRHTKAVKCLHYWEGLARPILISGDEEGLLLCWDLLTKKPFASFACGGQIVCFQQFDDLLFVTSKDHTLRIIKFPMAVLASKVQSELLASLELVYEIPVNTLNFSNTLAEQLPGGEFRLWCCNTQNSDLIDIYEFSISGSKHFCRKQKGISLYETISTLINPNVTKLDKLGIMMKLVAFEGTIYCGFESGFIVGLQLHQSTLHVVYVSSVHYPDPVLNMTVGEDVRKVISSSISSDIGFHQKRETSPLSSSMKTEKCYALDDKTVYEESKKCPLNKISHIEQLDGVYVASSWNGITKVFDIGLGVCLKEISKERAQVQIEGNNIGNATFEKEPTNIKVTSMLCISKKNYSAAENLLKTIREGERRRISRFFSETWCLLGYDDGSISANQI